VSTAPADPYAKKASLPYYKQQTVLKTSISIRNGGLIEFTRGQYKTKNFENKLRGKKFCI